MEYWLIFFQNWIKSSNLGIYKVQQTPTSKKKITPYAHYTKLLKTTNEKKILKNSQRKRALHTGRRSKNHGSLPLRHNGGQQTMEWRPQGWRKHCLAWSLTITCELVRSYHPHVTLRLRAVPGASSVQAPARPRCPQSLGCHPHTCAVLPKVGMTKVGGRVVLGPRNNGTWTSKAQ